MTASFGDNETTARIEWCLVGTKDSGIFAIAEVKPRVRNRVKWPELLWQETAEMVSWILHDDEESRKTPDHQPLSLGPLHFMRMQEYGPWNIKSMVDMDDSARILVGWAFKVTGFIVGSET
ncbi:hypothetical protein EN45_084780 [Penicillium chrysogenum]|nr:hypothetical protein EN45_084780 [Penicillium chrysogenum]